MQEELRVKLQGMQHKLSFLLLCPASWHTAVLQALQHACKQNSSPMPLDRSGGFHDLLAAWS
jgi:hypothetical protein